MSEKFTLSGWHPDAGFGKKFTTGFGNSISGIDKLTGGDPHRSETVTSKEVVVSAETIIELPDSPLLHEYVYGPPSPPDESTVSVACDPAHIACGSLAWI